MYICNYCNKEYSSKGILENHQKTAKFCLIRQKKEIVCEYCDAITFSQNDLENHQNNCINFFKI